MASLSCSYSECKKRLTQVNGMNFKELEEYNEQCTHCGSWIIKDDDIANRTYHAVSNKWAIEFMNEVIKDR